jgi:hypothetical protein
LNPVNSLIFHSIKTATQSHLQTNSLYWLASACDNLVHPCNTLSDAAVRDTGRYSGSRPGRGHVQSTRKSA